VRFLLEDGWAWLQSRIEEGRRILPPSLRDGALATLPGPILGWLQSTAAIAADDLRDEAVSFLSADASEALVPTLVRVLRAAAKTVAPKRRAVLGIEDIAAHCARKLKERLGQPARAEGDWSIALPQGCRCALCGTLAAFLSDPKRQQLEWPLAKERRAHVHSRLDSHELPVDHETRRSGSPYTLVLTKTKALFEREAALRRAWQADFDWLARMPSPRRPGRAKGARKAPARR
jgi:hypothetical protein